MVNVHGGGVHHLVVHASQMSFLHSDVDAARLSRTGGLDNSPVVELNSGCDHKSEG